MWVLVDRDFLIRVPQLEHCWEVYAGLTATVIRPFLTPKSVGAIFQFLLTGHRTLQITSRFTFINNSDG
jgi:hypothetical protein